MINTGIFERGDTFSHWVTIRDRNGSKANASVVSQTIRDPCNHAVLSGASMTHSSTGEYYYNYRLQSNATYGRYTVSVNAVDATGNPTVFEDEFYIMPWKLEKTIRRITGVADAKDISDDDLSHIAWTSYKESLRNVYIHHYKETPSGNPDTGASFDGTNTSFQTHHYPIADINGDGSVGGTNSCATDISCWWINSNGSRQEADVSVTNSRNGEISITQHGVLTAIPSSNEGVYLDYWHTYDSFDEFIFREAVSYLAAHYVNLRFTERDKVTLADINSSRPVILIQPNRFLKEYKRLMNLIRKPKFVGAS